MQKKITVFVLFFQYLLLYGQKIIEKIDEKIDKAGYLSEIGQSNKSLPLLMEANKMSKKVQYKKGELTSGQMLMSVYKNRGEYKKSLEASIYLEELARTFKSNKDLIIIYQTRSMIYSKLGYQKQSLIEVRKAIPYTEKVENNLQRYYLALNYQQFASIYEEMQKQDSVIYYLKKSLSELENIREDAPKNLISFKLDYILFTTLNIGNYYTGIHQPQRLDLAEKFYMKALSFKDTNPQLFKVNETKVYNSLGRFYNAKKEYKSAILYAERALSTEKNSKDPNSRRLSYGVLSEAYEGIFNKEKNLKYLKLYTYINDSLQKAEKSSITIPLEQTIRENQKKSDKKIIYVYIISVCTSLCCIFYGFIIWRRSVNKLKRDYEATIYKIKKEMDGKNKEVSLFKSSSISISDETVEYLLINLEKFEESNEFIKKDVTLSYLSNYLSINNRYLSEVLKVHRNKTFSRYINSLRINYIIKLLYTEPKYREYKAEALAELCGFSSREVFGLAFKKETKITPSYYISQLKKQTQH